MLTFSSNIYARRVLSGEFQVVCPWLLRDLIDLGIWDDNMRNLIIAHNGSIQNIPNIPDQTKAIYKTAWEISQKTIIDLSSDRGAFVCQSQSLNIHLRAPSMGQLTSMHFYGWKRGLKTGMYYLRTRPAAQAIQFTVDQNPVKISQKQSTPPQSTPAVVVDLITSTSPSSSPTIHAHVSDITTPTGSVKNTSTPTIRPSFSDKIPTSVINSDRNLKFDENMFSAIEANPDFTHAWTKGEGGIYIQEEIRNTEGCSTCSG